MPYKLAQSNSGYFVVNDAGERKNKQPMSRSRALRFLRALYVNVADATTKAANYSATAGQVIAGALGRGGDGKFTRVGSSDGDKARKMVQDIARKQQQKQAKKKPTKGKSKRATAAKKPAPKKGTAPKKSDAQKEQERQAKLAQRQAEREQRRKDAEAKKQQEQQANRDRVLGDLQEDERGALEDLIKNGTTGDDGGLEKKGLAERADDGSYRLTPAGRALYDAATSGDQGRANEAISRAQDAKSKRDRDQANREARATERETAKRERTAEREKRRAEREAKQKERQSKGGSSGKSKPSEADKQAQREQQRANNRGIFAGQAGIRPDDAEALSIAASNPTDRNDRLVSAGLQNEQGEATDQGRRFLNAVERGDLRGAQAALQDARQRQEREAARNERQQRISQRRQNRSIRRVKASLDEPATLSVFKASNGQWRWIIRSGSAFLDRDREIFSRKALIDAVARNRERGYYGPLRWWHCGEIDTVARKAGPGLDIGDCDFSGVIGRTLVESGTFREERYARAAEQHAAKLKASLGVVYKPLDISADRVYDRLDIVERSLCPADKARNQLSGSLHVFQR